MMYRFLGTVLSQMAWKMVHKAAVNGRNPWTTLSNHSGCVSLLCDITLPSVSHQQKSCNLLSIATDPSCAPVSVQSREMIIQHKLNKNVSSIAQHTHTHTDTDTDTCVNTQKQKLFGRLSSSESNKAISI